MPFTPGSSVTLTAQFYEYSGGPAVNLTEVSIQISPAAGGAPLVGPTGSGITNPATGLYSYGWAIPSYISADDYAVVWSGTDPQGDAVQATETVTVAGTGGGWATVSQVTSITGVAVDAADVAYAQAVIETYCGRTFDGSAANDSIRPKDKVWLQKAVAFQAVWQVQQPGYFGRHSIKEVDQDGARVIYAGSAESNNSAMVMLAPLAARAIKNLSWMRSRTIRVKPPSYEGPNDSYGDYKRSDDHPGWSPL